MGALAVGDSEIAHKRKRGKQHLSDGIGDAQPIKYEGFYENVIERATRLNSRVNARKPSVHLYNVPTPATHVQCGDYDCRRFIPRYYAHQFRNKKTGYFYLNCEDCVAFAWQESTDWMVWYESQPWSSQHARRLAIQRWMEISPGDAEEFMARMAVVYADKTENPPAPELHPISKVIAYAEVHKLQPPKEDLPTEDSAGLKFELELHELTGFVNDQGLEIREIKAILELTRTIQALTGELIIGLSAARLRGRAWKARQLAGDIQSSVPKTRYESAGYEL